MVEPRPSSHQLYNAWIEDQIEEYKAGLSREQLMELADEAVQELFHTPTDQIPLTEILLRDAVDELIFRRLKLPTYRRWLRLCQIDTDKRPLESTPGDGESSGEAT